MAITLGPAPVLSEGSVDSDGDPPYRSCDLLTEPMMQELGLPPLATTTDSGVCGFRFAGSGDRFVVANLDANSKFCGPDAPAQIAKVHATNRDSTLTQTTWNGHDGTQTDLPDGSPEASLGICLPSGSRLSVSLYPTYDPSLGTGPATPGARRAVLESFMSFIFHYYGLS